MVHVEDVPSEICRCLDLGAEVGELGRKENPGVVSADALELGLYRADDLKLKGTCRPDLWIFLLSLASKVVHHHRSHADLCRLTLLIGELGRNPDHLLLVLILGGQLKRGQPPPEV